MQNQNLRICKGCKISFSPSPTSRRYCFDRCKQKDYRQKCRNYTVSYLRKYYQDNKSELLKKNKEYREKNKLAIAKRRKTMEYKAKKKIWDRRYNLNFKLKATPDKLEARKVRRRINTKVFALKNPEKVKRSLNRWRENNWSYVRAYALKQNRGSDVVTPEVIDYVVKRDGSVCQYCGVSVTKGEMNIDHIYPFSKGGLGYHFNLAVTCKACNEKKGSRTNDIMETLYKAGEKIYNLTPKPINYKRMLEIEV